MTRTFSPRAALLLLLGAGVCQGAASPTNVPVSTNISPAAKSSPAPTNAPIAWSISDSNPAPALGQIPTPGTVSNSPVAASELFKKCQVQLDLGREQRGQKSGSLATQTLSALVTGETPSEIRRQALFELALVAQDEGKFIRAEQIFGQYLQTYPEDPSAPEVVLRQGLIYRQMGVNSLAVSKFYAVMYSALKLKLENMDYYKKIVLQSQVEIADTYYQEGKYEEAADFFQRLLKAANVELDRTGAQYKLVRSLSYSTNVTETIAQAQVFLNLYTNALEVPEVRFFLASSLKKVGRNNDAMKQVLLLLQSQEENVKKNPDTWTYWQQRAGNEIANQLFKEGDYLNALQIYISLTELDKSPAWQLPLWYQTGLVYEQLQQWQKATATYAQIQARRKELTEGASTPSLVSLLDMAKWRKDYIEWMQKAKLTQQSFVLTQTTNTTPSTNIP